MRRLARDFVDPTSHQRQDDDVRTGPAAGQAGQTDKPEQ
jgi:hypothetical protein